MSLDLETFHEPQSFAAREASLPPKPKGSAGLSVRAAVHQMVDVPSQIPAPELERIVSWIALCT